jgi:hypothetical protein
MVSAAEQVKGGKSRGSLEVGYHDLTFGRSLLFQAECEADLVNKTFDGVCRPFRVLNPI